MRERGRGRGRGGANSRGGGGVRDRVPSSTPWSRLKPVEMDPLEAMGLPSKGDNRLLDFKTQERYYTKIVERYMTFCSDAGERDELLRRFASLDVNANNNPNIGGSRGGSSSGSSENQHLSSLSTTPGKPATSSGITTSHIVSLSAAPRAPTSSSTSTRLASSPSVPPSLATLPSDTKALTEVLSALRKLREGIVASKRADDFAVQAYLFCIRLSVLVKHPESYHPAILHLLRRMTTTSTTTTSRQSHDDASSGKRGGNSSGGLERSSSATTTKSTTTTTQTSIMTSVEHAEVASYLVLDTACRRADLADAHALRRRYGLHDARVDGVLRALAHDDWAAFSRLRSRADGHRARLLEWAEPQLRRHLLKCFARAYLRVDRAFLERSAGAPWAALTKDEGVGWELEGESGETVVIRKVKGR